MTPVHKGISISLLILAVITSGCEKKSNNDGSYFSQHIRTGTSAIDFTARSIENKYISLSNFRGKVVLMTFWRKRCKECIRDLDKLESLYKSFKSRGLVVIAINANNLDYVPSHRIQEFVKGNAYTFTVLLDDQYAIAEIYKPTKLPMTYLINKKGIITYISYGENDWMSQENIKRIEKLL